MISNPCESLGKVTWGKVNGRRRFRGNQGIYVGEEELKLAKKGEYSFKEQQEETGSWKKGERGVKDEPLGEGVKSRDKEKERK